MRSKFGEGSRRRRARYARDPSPKNLHFAPIFGPSPAVAVSTLKRRVKRMGIDCRRDQLPAVADVFANVGIEGAALARELAVLEGIAAAERRAAPAWFSWRRTQGGGCQDPLLHMQHPMARSSSCSCSRRLDSSRASRRRSRLARASSLFFGGSSSSPGERKREFNSAFFGAGG